MSRRTPRQTAAFSLFTFLDVMLCTLGALIIVLICVVRTAQIKNSDLTPQAAEEIEEMISERDTVRWGTDKLVKSRDASRKILQDRRLELSHIEEHTRRLQAQLAELEAAEAALARNDAHGKQLDRLRAEVERLAGLAAEAEQEVEIKRAEVQNRRPSFAVIPYDGPSQTLRRPMYIECRADRVILQPENIEIPAQDFAGPLGPGNPLAAGLRAAREYLMRNQSADLGDQGEPYPLLLVRPDGIAAFYVAREAMSSWGSEFGYEFIDADWQLEFREPQPAMVDAMRLAVSEARGRQRALARAAPRIAAQHKREYYRVSPRGGVVRDSGGGTLDDEGEGDGSGGAEGRYVRPNERGGYDYVGSGGSGRSGGGRSGSGPGGAYAGTRGAVAAADRSAAGAAREARRERGAVENNPYLAVANGTAGGGMGSVDAPGNNRGGPGGSGGPGAAAYPVGAGGNAVPGALGGGASGSAGGPLPDEHPLSASGGGNGSGPRSFLSGGGGAGDDALPGMGSGGGSRQTVGSGNAPGGAQRDNIGGFSGNSYGAGGLTAINGDSIQQGGSADAAGNSASGVTGTGDGSGRAAGGVPGRPGAKQLAGGPSSGGDGGTGDAAGQSGGQGGGKPGANSGGNGSGQAGGRPGQQGAGKLGMQPGGSYAGGGQGGSGSQPGNPGGQAGLVSASASGSEGGQPSGGNNLQMGTQSSRAGGGSSRTANASLADSRGKNWGLPEEARRAVPITRPVRIECLPDKLVLRSEQNPKQTQEIPLGGRTEESVESLVAAVWSRVDTWGAAGKGMYWHPTLSVDVAPGADGRFADLQTLLADSGLEVKAAPKAPVEAVKPKRRLGLW